MTAYLNYSAFSEPGEAGTRLLNSSHPPLTHMQAFDEEWESSLPTEFSMRPELTPTKVSDAQQKSTLTFEKPDLEGTPSMPRKDDSHQSGDASAVRRSSVNVRKIPAQVMSAVKKSIISFVIFFCIMSCLLVLIIESDSQMFAHLRKLPEMDLFRRDYYEPLKESISHIFRR